jgi:hypothetical protein
MDPSYLKRAEVALIERASDPMLIQYLAFTRCGMVSTFGGFMKICSTLALFGLHGVEKERQHSALEFLDPRSGEI